MALSLAFKEMRGGAVVDLNKIIADAEAGTLPVSEFTVGEIQFKNGLTLKRVVLDTEKDRADFQSFAKQNGGVGAAEDDEDAPGPSLTLSIHGHLGDLARAKRADKTIMESEHSLRLLLGVLGEKPVNWIDTDDCRNLLDAVNHWPKNASRRPEFQGMSVLEIVEAGRREKALAIAEGHTPYEPAGATVRKHRQRLSVFFNSLKKAGKLKNNPLHGIPAPAKDDDEGGRAYTQAELDQIFESATFAAWVGDLPHRFWGPLLALYSGARRNEIGQLYVADITEEKTADEQPVWGFTIAKRFPGQMIKGAASKRFVPLAKPILDAGFLAYVDDVKTAGHTRLFPHLPNTDGSGFGKQLGRQYIAYLNSLGQKEAGMGLHYFRNTLITRLNRAKVDDGTIDSVTGHKNERTTIRKHYIDPPTLQERVDALALFKPGVSIPSYRPRVVSEAGEIKPGQFDAALKVAHGLPKIWDKAKKKRIAKKVKADSKKAAKAKAK